MLSQEAVFAKIYGLKSSGTVKRSFLCKKKQTYARLSWWVGGCADMVSSTLSSFSKKKNKTKRITYFMDDKSD